MELKKMIVEKKKNKKTLMRKRRRRRKKNLWTKDMSDVRTSIYLWTKDVTNIRCHMWCYWEQEFGEPMGTVGFDERTGKDPIVLGACFIYFKELRYNWWFAT
jgi:hypothetical protein